MKKAGFISFVILFLMVSVSYADLNLYNLKDTNSIRITAINRNGKIEILVFYENTDKGLDVLWSNDTLEYECYLYNSSDSQIARKDGELHSFNQRIYITIPSWDRNEDEVGTVKCKFDIGWPHLKAEDKVSLK